MNVIRLSAALAVTTAMALVLQSCDKPAPKTEAKAPFSVVEASIPDMQAAMKDGRTTSKEIVTQYLARIGMYEDKLHAAVAINPQALVEAEALDKERAAGHVRGPLHGIPIALKDNIMDKDDMPTSGGMLAFKTYMAPYDATLAANLKKAGAIIIAKSTMSELAGWFGGDPIPTPGGYNGAAGQSYNPYDPRAREDGTPILDTSGSSSGIGVAANLWTGNVGTSTGGSIEGPSNANMLVGIRPSTGRISRYGIVPLTLDQDTAGPMTKTVTDAAIMLGVLEGDPDPNDARTTTCKAPDNHDYTSFLKADALKGARIGIPRGGIYSAIDIPGRARQFPGLRADELEAMEGAIAALKAAGAEVVDPADIPSAVATDAARNLSLHGICQKASESKGAEELCSNVLRYGMKRDFNIWLASLDDKAPVKTLTEFLKWNLDHKDFGAIKYGQARLEVADSMDLEKDKARYEADRANDLKLTRDEGLDAVMTTNKLDVLLFPGSSGANYATKAGYPIMTVPYGMTANPNPGAKGSPDKTRPFGVSFVGKLCDEPKMLAIGYAFEQATKKRVPPAPAP
jgi:amidase